ncbi:flagellar hook-associated protein FlgL [Clostridium aestuarii]|uniref:Flagellar hook-associated protein FlgL n=1 Tax=Clostridium aestuarii TaxID=338193 RepID=A0ABT4CXE4_9CLOT|nr:flagellar hook-associated protein FlgL [Clostridium aestuarii]MCY6483656.1 flagellar hook-associated protein FlgL [Clostridium aestuarii]
MRVTNKMLSNSFLNDMRTNLEHMKTLQEQLTSGKQIRKPSDDPFKVARTMQLHTEIDANKQYNENISDTINWLDTTDTAIGQLGDVVHRVRELLISAGNAGYSKNERRAIKDEINEKIGEFSQIMNTSFDGKYLFGGSRATTKPVDVKGGVEYKGALKVNINISDLNETLKSKDVEIKLNDGSASSQTITLTKDTTGKKFKDISALASEINKQLNEDNKPFKGKLKAVPIISESSITFVYDEAKVDASTDPTEINVKADNISGLDGKVINKATVNDSGNAELVYYKKGGAQLETVEDSDTDDGKQYNMLNQKLKTEISQGVIMDYNVTAPEILKFKNSENKELDLKEIFEAITNHLDGKDSKGTELDDDAIGKLVKEDLQNITDAMDNILKVRSEVGAKQNRMESAKQVNVDRNFNMTEILSKTEDIDITEKTMEFATMQTVYIASLQTSAKVLQPSLMDYLR